MLMIIKRYYGFVSVIPDWLQVRSIIQMITTIDVNGRMTLHLDQILALPRERISTHDTDVIQTHLKKTKNYVTYCELNPSGFHIYISIMKYGGQ